MIFRCRKIVGFGGAPDLTEGAHSAPQDPLVVPSTHDIKKHTLLKTHLLRKSGLVGHPPPPSSAWVLR